jgi:transcription antitermination factor NusG
VVVSAYKKGEVITIPSGPFQGKEASVQEIQNNKLRLVLVELGILITLTKESQG